MHLIEFIKYLDDQNIYDQNIPNDIIDFYNETFEKDNIYITLHISEDTDYKIEFNMYVSWKIKKENGDGYITPIYDYIEDVEIEIELINIEDYINNQVIELNDEESINQLEDWIESKVYNKIYEI